MAGLHTQRFYPPWAVAVVLGIWIFLAPPLGAATTGPGPVKADPFTLFPVIKPNVDFWKQIFSLYDRDQGVIHDTRHLDRIYEVIDLDPSTSDAAFKENKKAKKAVIKKYKTLLLALAKGKAPGTPLEKKTAALFGPKAKPSDYRAAAQRLRCQTGLKSHFRAGLIRSGAVIGEFRRIFRSHGLPEDLTYLPCVESSFDFKAYSKFGAAGIWQFTRSTGRLFMDIGYVVDQRRDPYISTDAAARLLKKNFSNLQDWPSAITAYNHGLAGMRRAKKAKGSYEQVFLTYSSRSFKFASRNFYSEFLAARDVAKNYKKYFGDLPFLKPHDHTLITTTDFLPALDFTKALGLPIHEFQELNPSLRSPVYKGLKYIPKGFQIRLPAGINQKTALAAAKPLYYKTQKPSRFHVVKKGDTASAIAQNNNVSLRNLITANGLNRRAVIYVGQNLRIPSPKVKAAAPAKPEPAPKAPATRPKPVEPAPVKPKPVAEAAPSQKTAPPEAPGESRAQAVPDVGKGMDPQIDTSNLKVREIQKNGKQLVGLVLVEAEETLGHYAEWLGISTNKIRSLNRFAYDKPISIHQKIKIPLPGTGPEAFEGKRFEFHREMEEDFFESYMVTGVETYKVKPGDTLWSLCVDELEIPFWLLKKYNPKMDFNKLRPGKPITYPLVTNQAVGPL